MDPQNIRVLIAVLVPIAPALMIFWLLPSSAEVEGPYQGLKIKLGGAFGGYFLVVLSIFGYFLTNPVPQDYEVWRIEGRISDTTPDPKVTLVPQISVLEKTGDFTFRTVLERRPDGSLRFPKVVVESQAQGYRATTIPLDPGEQEQYGAQKYKLSVQPKNHEIQIVDVIELRKKEATQ